MVDILKLPSQPSTSFFSNALNLRCKTPSQQMTTPIFLSNIKQCPVDSQTNSFYPKRWTGRCPGDPPRLLDVAHVPYSLHRKIMYQELSRPIPGRNDQQGSNKYRQQPLDINRDSAKIANAPSGTSATAQTSLLGIHVQSTRLFDTLSKHIIVKGEPLRPSNNLTNNSTSTLTTWQRYWASTHAERRRKGTTEPEPVFYRPKLQPSPVPAQTRIIFLRDSPSVHSDSQSNCRTPGSPPSSCDVAKLSSSLTPDGPPLTRDEQIEYDSHPSEQQDSSSLTLPSTLDVSSSMATSKISITIPLNLADDEEEEEGEEEKDLQEKSLLLSPESSSHFKSDSQLIEEVAGAQPKTQPVTAKVYQFTTPAPKKKSKKVASRQRKRSKSTEKKETGSTSAAKRDRQVPAVANPMIKPNKLSSKSKPTAKTTTAITATPRSKYCEEKWEEPYVGVRFDPPTPPCSPSVLLWSQEVELDGNDTPLEKSQLFPSNSKDNDQHSCIF